MRFEVKQSFVKSLKKLENKYRHIKNDLRPILMELEQNPTAGVAIPGFANLIWKIRVNSSDMKRGKSGGFRLIYALKEREKLIVLLLLYAKSDQEDVTVAQIKKLLE